jgi:drug/metabolite transporter (DMT)-like permease
MTSSINTSMGIREWSMLITLSILWGGSFYFVGVAVADLPPLTIVLLRVGLAALALWAIALIMGIRPPPNPGVWLAFFAMGFLNNVLPFTLIVWGQTQIASGVASILNAATPLFTVVVAGLLLPDERATVVKVVGVVVGLGGVIMMIGVPTVGEGDSTLAQLAILAATISYAFASVYGRRFKVMMLNPMITAAGQVTASTLILLPVALYIDEPFNLPMPSPGTWAAIVGLAVLSTAMAYVLFFKILESAGATNLMLVTLLVPVSAILLGSLFLDESLRPVHFIGMALIAVGLFAIDGRLLKRNNGGRQAESGLSAQRLRSKPLIASRWFASKPDSAIERE